MAEISIASTIDACFLEFSQTKDRKKWLDLFDDNAVVMHPVGESFLDPSGNGYCGKEAIAYFYDRLIAPSSVDLELEFAIPHQYECASFLKMHHRLSSGERFTQDMVIIFKVNESNKIISLKSYWEANKLLNVLAA